MVVQPFLLRMKWLLAEAVGESVGICVAAQNISYGERAFGVPEAQTASF